MRFRTKTTEIEAIRFEYTKDGIEKLKQFCGDALGNVNKNRHPSAKGEAELRTSYRDGKYSKVEHFVLEGDWIIKSSDGRLYPCSHSIFEASYEPVDKIPLTLADLIREEQEKDRLSY